MACMIPSECDLTRRPFSERIVFAALQKNLSEEWRVFHSFDYVVRDLQLKRWDGEVDFLLYHPSLGILIMEVKGGAISHSDGQWYQETRRIDPVDQAKRNKYAVMKLLQEGLKRPIPLKFAHCVCFPSCGRQSVWPPEAKGLVITGEDLDYVEHIATQILENTQIPPHLCGSLPEADVLRILTPEFEYGSRLFERIAADEERFFRFTEQQCALLDALEHFKRLQIRGCAGSGKTLMAIKKARQLAAQGKRVLLLCFNQMLAKHLQKAVKDEPLIQAAAFFEFCIDLMAIPEDQVDQHRMNPRLYSEILPHLLRNHLEKTMLSFEAVIVDEGQDFAAETWEVIELLPDSEAHFYIFYDPDQNIFQRDLKLPDFGIPPVVLTRNCRNTRKIFEALKPYLTLEATVMESTPEGADVRILHGDVRTQLEAELTRLTCSERLACQDIVILGAHTLKNTSIGESPEVGRFRILENSAASEPLEINYYTYMKYKGCEARAVILLDVDDSDLRWRDKSGLYTAMSRAVHQLVILKK